MTDTVRIFIGFDQKEAVAYHTLCHSILSRASVPVSFTPIKRSMLKDIHSRPLDQKQSNEFSFTRFLVPYLCEFKGFAIFMDCDMLVRTDIRELWNLQDPSKALQVVKHNYTPKHDYKYLGTRQYTYPKKNWSSVVLWNCNHFGNRGLTPYFIDKADGATLHQFKWLKNKYGAEYEKYIGELPQEWNHLVSEYPPNPKAKNVHFTVGGPYFNEYENCEFSDEWFEERAQMQHCDQLPAPKIRVSAK